MASKRREMEYETREYGSAISIGSKRIRIAPGVLQRHQKCHGLKMTWLWRSIVGPLRHSWPDQAPTLSESALVHGYVSPVIRLDITSALESCGVII